MLRARSEETRAAREGSAGTRGFTLIELLTVIIIIAILATVAIPLFLQQRKRGYESAARQQIGAISKTQESYYSEYDAYTTDLTTGSEDGLWGQGWRADPGVVVSVTLSNAAYPTGICITSYAVNLPGSVFHFTNVGPGAGNIQETTSTTPVLPACV